MGFRGILQYGMLWRMSFVNIDRRLNAILGRIYGFRIGKMNELVLVISGCVILDS